MTSPAAGAPDPRPRASLGRVVDGLGATLLELVHGDPEAAGDVGGVVIHDPLDAPVLPPGALVLGVGIETPEAVVALVEALGAARAAALVVRAPVPVTPEVRRTADAAGVVLLGLSRGAPWAHLAAIVRSLLAEGDVGVTERESLGGLPSGDLFAVANAIAALLDAPVTIEDRSSRVLAFSGRQDEADASRVETILGRQVPERYARILNERGVFRDLHRSDEPVFIDPPAAEGSDAFTVPRVAIAVRAGDEVLGSIWAAVREPLSEERTIALQESAKLVALHLLRVRAGADVQRRLRADLLSSALEGGAGARAALDRLGLTGQPLMVLGVAVTGVDADVSTTEGAAVTHERERLSDAFALHLSAAHPRAAAALVSGVTYGLVPVTGQVEEGETRAVRIAHDFLDRVGDRLRPVIGIGPVATDLAGLTQARTSVDRALRVLRSGGGGRRVARLDDIQVESLMLELHDLAAARGDRPTGSLARLIDYDRRHHSSLVETLQAWLEAFGDVTAASEALYVHPNTFRYRLRRVAEVGEIDLADPEQRFVAMLQLRVLARG
ncbi:MULTISPECIES: PucR family transcriptional regulator [unclassified Nocardioides]|uniref:PucR family transcriptional regulator n=1 Tax=unclassified Nocardioides TaxID=2615069 RepID=UPI003612F61C